jgi:photosystem II stability/assembly factor-like uncharacterized protein
MRHLTPILFSVGALLCGAPTAFAAEPAAATDAAAVANSVSNSPAKHASFREAPLIKRPERAPMLAATLAGKRIVAVGDYGIVILSDDTRTFRQAKRVPTRAVLTSVFFIDDKTGWAAGHDGTVLGTRDGGETWSVLREEPGKERALLSVWFENETRGFAVGQFGLVVETGDGGKTWRERRLIDAGEAGEKHLMHIFAARAGSLFVAAEAGAIFRSTDSGRTWSVVQTSNKGSFWTGLALADGTLLAAGMRGHVYRSVDNGNTWDEVPSGTLQSLTGAVQREDGSVLLVGMSGVSLRSSDQGRNFVVSQRPDRNNLTAAAAKGATEVLFTLTGAVTAN